MSYKRIERSIENIKIKSKNNQNYKTNEKSFTRNRKMEFKDFIWYMTLQKGRTTSIKLDEYLKAKNNTYKISISKQAFSKQRLNLKPEMFKDFYINSPKEVKKYKGYHVLAIDDSMFEIPNTKELREIY